MYCAKRGVLTKSPSTLIRASYVLILGREAAFPSGTYAAFYVKAYPVVSVMIIGYGSRNRRLIPPGPEGSNGTCSVSVNADTRLEQTLQDRLFVIVAPTPIMLLRKVRQTRAGLALANNGE